jgi:exonuclease V
MDTSWDEYDAYDLSEFSAADFVHIDGNTTSATTRHNNRATAPEEDKEVVITDGDWTRAIETGGSGGLPQVALELEPATDEPVVVKVAGGGSGSGDSIVVVDGALRLSPLEEFRSQTLSVSDLVGPAWYIPSLFFLLVMG